MSLFCFLILFESFECVQDSAGKRDEMTNRLWMWVRCIGQTANVTTVYTPTQNEIKRKETDKNKFIERFCNWSLIFFTFDYYSNLFWLRFLSPIYFLPNYAYAAVTQNRDVFLYIQKMIFICVNKMIFFFFWKIDGNNFFLIWNKYGYRFCSNKWLLSKMIDFSFVSFRW